MDEKVAVKVEAATAVARRVVRVGGKMLCYAAARPEGYGVAGGAVDFRFCPGGAGPRALFLAPGRAQGLRVRAEVRLADGDRFLGLFADAGPALTLEAASVTLALFGAPAAASGLAPRVEALSLRDVDFALSVGAASLQSYVGASAAPQTSGGPVAGLAFRAEGAVVGERVRLRVDVGARAWAGFLFNASTGGLRLARLSARLAGALEGAGALVLHLDGDTALSEAAVAGVVRTGAASGALFARAGAARRVALSLDSCLFALALDYHGTDPAGRVGGTAFALDLRATDLRLAGAARGDAARVYLLFGETRTPGTWDLAGLRSCGSGGSAALCKSGCSGSAHSVSADDCAWPWPE